MVEKRVDPPPSPFLDLTVASLAFGGSWLE